MVERFERFRFSVPAVPLQKGFSCISVQFNRKGRFRFRFRFLENGSGGSGSAFGFGKNPNLLFLAFFLFKEFLVFLSVFPFFPKDFRGSAGRRNPCLFGGFPRCFPKRQGKEDQGNGSDGSGVPGSGSVPEPPCKIMSQGKVGVSRLPCPTKRMSMMQRAASLEVQVFCLQQ